MKVFFDCEFTGLHQHTTLISVGMVDENGRSLYAEFSDYDKTQVNDWIHDNVIANLSLQKRPDLWMGAKNEKTSCRGNMKDVGRWLLEWLSIYDHVEFWSDVLAYDWVLLVNLLANYDDGYPKMPNNIYYIPFDLATLIKIGELDPDISREELAGLEDSAEKHNALWDAKVIKACYEKMIPL